MLMVTPGHIEYRKFGKVAGESSACYQISGTFLHWIELKQTCPEENIAAKYTAKPGRFVGFIFLVCTILIAEVQSPVIFTAYM